MSGIVHKIIHKILHKIVRVDRPWLLYLCSNLSNVMQGRVDSQIKVRGHRVDMLEIERTVTKEPRVKAACVICYKSGEPTQKVLCYFTAEDVSYY
jgi:hypothetical protein